jgi:hypothetical protein
LATPLSAQAQSPQDPGHSVNDVVRVVIKSPCFDNESLADEIEEWLGRDTIDHRVQSIQVRASQGVLSYAIEMEGQPPTVREFPELPRDCTEQRSAIGLSIALAVDALESDLIPVEPPPAPQFQLTGFGILTTGVPSVVGLGGGLGVEWRPGRVASLRIGIEGVTSARSQRLRDDLDFEYGSRLITSRTEGCLRGTTTHVEIAGCGGFRWGALWTVPSGQFAGNTTSHGWYALSVSAELRFFTRGSFGVLVGVDLILPLRETTVAVRDEFGALSAWRQFPSVTGALRVGPTLSF